MRAQAGADAAEAAVRQHEQDAAALRAELRRAGNDAARAAAEAAAARAAAQAAGAAAGAELEQARRTCAAAEERMATAEADVARCVRPACQPLT